MSRFPNHGSRPQPRSNVQAPPAIPADPLAPRTCFSCRTILLVTAVSVPLASVTALCVAVIMLYPSSPTLRLDSIEVSRLHISTSLSEITAHARAKFLVRNPNKLIAITYEQVQACIHHKDFFLGCSRIQSFHQGTKSQSVVFATVNVTAKSLNEDALRAAVDEMGRVGALGFQVGVSSVVWFDPGSRLLWRWEVMWALCKDVKIGFVSNNKTIVSMLGGPIACQSKLSV